MIFLQALNNPQSKTTSTEITHRICYRMSKNKIFWHELEVKKTVKGLMESWELEVLHRAICSILWRSLTIVHINLPFFFFFFFSQIFLASLVFLNSGNQSGCSEVRGRTKAVLCCTEDLLRMCMSKFSLVLI